MKYQRMMSERDTAIPYLESLFKLPEISHYISIDEQNYWKYVTTSRNVYFFKAYDDGHLVATIVLGDIQSGNLISGFNRIEVPIDENNIASVRLFEKMGFDFVSKEDELLNYTYEVNREE